ncbi:MAG TPA: MliC family protein [Candidatus Paceibacterota bacterium]|nr:MliC family protein [Candidatus Paceibacterota bacterium]
MERNTINRATLIGGVVLVVAVFAFGYWLGTRSVPTPEAGTPSTAGVIGDASYQCADEKSMHAVFYENQVTVMLSDGRTFNLAHTISGSGARYASVDDGIVFWEKGQSAFLEEAGTTTYSDCENAPIPL